MYQSVAKPIRHPIYSNKYFSVLLSGHLRVYLPASGPNLLHAGVHSQISWGPEAAADFAGQRKPELAMFVVGRPALVV